MVKILPILLLSIACAFAAPAAKVPVTLPLSKPHNPVAIHETHSKDLARWAFLATGTAFSVPAINADVSYYITIGLGTPAQNVELIFDTGSSDLWVKSANYSPTKSSTSTNLGETFSIEYGSGSTTGKEYTDEITIGSYTFKQEFGVATTSSGFTGVDGLVGFGPDDLSIITSGGENVPTPVDNLYTTGAIPSDVIGVYFQSITDGSTETTNGEVTFGGVDTTKYTGSLTYVPVTTVSPASYYWGIDVTSIKYGTASVLTANAGIVDTGTTLILLSSNAVASLYGNISGAKLDSTTGLYSFPTTQVANLKNLTFTIGGTVFTLTPSQYLVPTNQVAVFGGKTGTSYSWVGSLGETEVGLEFILGQKFLEHFYSVYDTTNKRLGLAPIA